MASDHLETGATWSGETADLFGERPWRLPGGSSKTRKGERARRREAVLRALDAPWEAWSGAGPTAKTARRFLARHPDLDRADPAYDILTDRQAAFVYHLEEAALEIERERL